MNKWNHSQDRGWDCHRFEAFARDCTQAWRRLIGRNLLGNLICSWPVSPDCEVEIALHAF